MTWSDAARSLLMMTLLAGPPAVQSSEIHGLRAGEQAQLFGGGTSVGNALLALPDAGWLLVGYTTAGESGGEDVLVVRTDKAGRAVWTRTIGGAGDESGWAVAPLSPDGFLIAGFTTSFGADGEDVLLIALGEDGRTRWTKTIGGAGNQRAWAMAPSAGAYFIAAQTDRGPGGGLDAAVFAVGADGVLRWSRTFGGAGTDRVFGVVVAADGGPTVAGLSSPAAGAPNNAYLVHLDPAGIVKWEQRVGDPNDLAHALALMPDGTYLLTGYRQSTTGHELLLIKCDANGRAVWMRTSGPAGDTRGMMSVVRADALVTIGYQRLPDKDWEIWVGDFGLDGTIRRHRTLGGASDDRGVMAAAGGPSELVVTGAVGRGASSALLWLRVNQ